MDTKLHTTSIIPQMLNNLRYQHLSHSYIGFPLYDIINSSNWERSFFGKTLEWYIFLTAPLILNFNYVYKCVSPYGNVHMSSGAQRGQKRVLSSLELELHMAVSCSAWMMETKVGSSSREQLSAVNCCVISPALFYCLYHLCLYSFKWLSTHGPPLHPKSLNLTRHKEVIREIESQCGEQHMAEGTWGHVPARASLCCEGPKWGSLPEGQWNPVSEIITK